MPEQLSDLKQTTTYTFKYNCEGDSMDINTLLVSQIHFATILNEIKNELAPEADLSIKIRPLEKGSVPFDITLNLSWLESLFGPAGIAYASGIVGIVVGLFQIRLWLKGEKPTTIEIQGDKIVITKGDVKLIVDRKTYEIYENNATIDLAIRKAFEAIEKDEEITDVEVLDEQKQPLIDIPREEFSSLTKPNEIFEELTETEPTRKESLTIFKVVFDKGYKWQFYLNGRKISASINDNAFMDRVNRGERFAKGDTLVVEMDVEKVYDKTMDIYIEKEFKVTKVISHTPRPEQKSMFDGTEQQPE